MIEINSRYLTDSHYEQVKCHTSFYAGTVGTLKLKAKMSERSSHFIYDVI